MNKKIGMLLLVLAGLTLVGMVLKNDAFWAVYNIVTLLVCLPAGVWLLKNKNS
jgi:hypothetical protein